MSPTAASPAPTGPPVERIPAAAHSVPESVNSAEAESANSPATARL